MAQRLRVLTEHAEGDHVRNVAALLLAARRPPLDLLQRRDARLAREQATLERRVAECYAQARAGEAQLAELGAQRADNARLLGAPDGDPYVQGLWIELRGAFAGEARVVAAALSHWRRIDAELSAAGSSLPPGSAAPEPAP